MQCALGQRAQWRTAHARTSCNGASADACSLRPTPLGGRPHNLPVPSSDHQCGTRLRLQARRGPHRPMLLQPLSAAAGASGGGGAPSGSGDSSAAAGQPAISGAGAVETNGTAAAAAARVMATAAVGISYDGGSESDEGSNGSSSGSGSDKPQIMRSSFRTILTRNYSGEVLFVVIGSLIGAALSQWTVGTPMRRFNPYSFQLTLPTASGVHAGTPLRMKGVPMGSVLSARPLLDRVLVEVEVNEGKTIIPRSAKFELTQSGMIPAASIDISPPEGVSAQVLISMVAARQQATAAAAAAAASSSGMEGGGGKDTAGATTSGSKKAKRAAAAAAAAKEVQLASPRDVAACRLQDVLVCQGDHIEGLQGGSMDELMAHTLKQLRVGETDAHGMVPGRGPIQN